MPPNGSSMKPRHALFLVALSMALPAVAGQAVPLLGLSLGGKFPEIKQCTMNQVGSDKVMCWIAAPTRGKDGMLGDINFPNSDSRPSWAAHGSYQVGIDADGILEMLVVRGSDAKDREEIMRSTESRFGPPSYMAPMAGGVEWASWKKGPVYIGLHCSRQYGCSADFKSEPAYKKELARMADAAARKAARPVSP
jgi:hypothetical protein